MRWRAVVPGDGTINPVMALPGQVVTVAAEHLRGWWNERTGRWSPEPPPGPRTGRIEFITLHTDGRLALTCDDAAEPARRHCDRCGRDVPAAMWRGDDHMVTLDGPLSIESVATDPDGNATRFRATLPYVVLFCAQAERTIKALDPQETP